MTENGEIRGPVRYIYELVNHLDSALFEIVLIAGVWQKDVYAPLSSRARVLYFDINRSRIWRALFFVFAVPLILKRHRIDVYHVPDTNPLPAFRFGAKIVSTIHDMAEYAVPYRFGKCQAMCRRFISRIQARRSHYVITVSRASRDDLVKYLHIPEGKIDVIHQGAPLRQPCTFDRNQDATAQHYVLYVGVLERAKNVDRLVEAYCSLPVETRQSTRLYLVGRKGNAYPRIEELIEQRGMASEIRMAGYVDDIELENLYRGATVFAYLSEYEGFGLPVIEAMRYGVPVLTSNKSSLPEIAGSAAITVETNVKSIASALEQLLSNESLRNELSSKGVRRAAEFSWERTARKTGSVYARAMAH